MISGPVTPWTREGLWGKILSTPGLLEHGLELVAQDLVLHEACTVDGVARDAAGRAVLLFAAVGGAGAVGLPVAVLEAHAFLQRNAAVLGRALPGSGIRFVDAWRIAVVAMDLPEARVRQIAALGLDRIEVYEVEPFSLAGEQRVVVRPVLGQRTGGGEDGFHVPSGLLDADRRSLCHDFLDRIRRTDPAVQVDGDRFSRRLSFGPHALAELRVEGRCIRVEVGDRVLELAGREDTAEIVDLILRRYLAALAPLDPEETDPGHGERRRDREVHDESGLSLEPLRRTVAETMISREEYSALGSSSAFETG